MALAQPVFVRIINNTHQLFTMNPDGGDQTHVPTPGNAFFPDGPG
jgi:hypothetical protein